MCFFRKTHIYTCFGNETYFEVVNKLNNAGIRHFTRFINNNPGRGGFTMTGHIVQYDIYVKKEDEYAALQAIHSKQ